jgi:NAD(P)H-dependent FMN reductase
MSAPHLIISCSLNPKSRSAVLAERLAADLRERDEPVLFVDLRTTPLPFCDAGACYADPQVQLLQESIKGATTVTMATPVYNYDVGGAARNLLAVTGRCWTGKTVGFMCAAGGHSSYMSLMGVANSLMLDFRCLIVPRFVYATGDDFDEGTLTSTAIVERVGGLADELKRLGAALATD